MKSLKHLHFFLCIVFCFFTVSVSWGQCPVPGFPVTVTGPGVATITMDGAGSTSVCPYTSYTIDVPAGLPAPIVFASVTNVEYSTDNVIWSGTGPTVPITGQIIYFRINALATTSRSITYSGTGGCGETFIVAPAAVTNIGDQTFCNGTDYTINFACQAGWTCGTYDPAPNASGEYSVQWTENLVNVQAGGPDNPITDATYTTYVPTTGSFPVSITTSYYNSPTMTCSYTENIMVTVAEAPVITTPFTYENGMAEICVHDDQDITITSGSTSLITYTLQYADASLVYSNLPGTSSASNTTGSFVYNINPETGAYTPGTPLAGDIPPGTYTLRATASIGTCSMTTAPQTFVINDRPAVQLGWRDGSAANGFSTSTGAYTYTNGTTICAGSGVEFSILSCAHTGYTLASQSVRNYHSDQTQPNRSQLNINPYDCPCYDGSAIPVNGCTGGNNTYPYFKTATWSIVSGTSTAFTNETISSAQNFVNISNLSIPENITYRVEVVDANDCRNYDDVIIHAESVPVEFRYSGVDYCSGDVIGVCPTSPALSIQGSGVDPTQVAPDCPGSGFGYYAYPDATETATGNPGMHTTFEWVRLATSTGTLLTPATHGPNTGNTYRTMTTSAPSAIGTTNWSLTMTDDWGCKGYGEITVDVADLAVDLSTTNTTVCYNLPLDLFNTSDAGYTYDVYKGGTCTAVGVCSGGTNVSETTTIITPGTARIRVPAGSVTSDTYWLIASAGTCKKVESIVITENPEITWGASTTTTSITEYCITPAVELEAEALGGSGGFIYSWAPSGIGGPPAPYPATQMGAAYSSGSPGYWGFTFVTITLFGNSIFFPIYTWIPGSATNHGYQFTTDIPPQTNAVDNSGMTLVVTDAANCTATRVWDLDFLNCGSVEIAKTKRDISSTVTPPVPFLTFKKYACVGDNVRLVASVVGSTSYTPAYEWNGLPALNSDTYLYPVTSTMDTVFSWCKVTNPNNGEIVGVVYDTTYISRGYLANVYPQDYPGTPDTVICLDDIVNAQARCYGCLGVIEYIWGSNTSGNIYLDNLSYDDSSFTATSVAAFPVNLEIQHGERCEDFYIRNVGVNANPNPILNVGGVPVASNPIYLCDGDVELLSVTGCGGCTFSWNTTATTNQINVSSQGGYFAQVVDGNSCRAVTDVAVVIAANDGLNAPVAANPNEICNNGNVILEVAPCVGCTYEWFSVAPNSSIGATRMHTLTGSSAAGDYYAEVTNAYGCVYNTSQLTVGAASVTIPSIITTTDSLCPGATATLTTPYNPNNSYQWYVDGNIISGATNNSFVAAQTGSYKVAVTYPNGCNEESPVRLISPVTYQPNLAVASYIVCNGQTADLQTDLYPGWQYQWYNNGVPISGAIGSIYNATSAGTHYVEVTTDYLCSVRSDSVIITTSTLNTNPLATTPTPSLCPGEEAELSASICTGCSYQWFEASGNTLTPAPTIGDFRYNFYPSYAGATRGYYVEVSKDGCTEKSDTIYITVNSVFTPAINTSSNVVCDGRNALLVTPGCSACSYSWLINGTPVLGALNDTFHLVDNPIDVGSYQIAVSYPNGCADTSAVLVISDGSYTLDLDVQSLPADYVICNGVGENLEAVPTPSLVGTYFYTLFLNNTPVTGFSNVTSNVFPNRNIAGVYTVQSIDPRGCIELSNLISLTSVTVQPQLASHATSDPTSVVATAICTDTGSVYLEVSNCVGCTFEWTLDGDSIGFTGTNYTSLLGDTATGTYIVIATNNGCSAVSNPVSIADLIGSIDSDANATDTSICNGQSVTLEHAASSGNPTLNCNGCAFRWLRGSVPGNSGNPINGASNYQYIAGTPGYYYLELTTAQGCVDTSSAVNIRQVDPPAGMMLNFDSATVGVGTPLAANGSTIDLNNWVFPPSVRNANLGTTVSSYFTSAPFNGALPAHAGLTGPDSIFFTPADSLSGFHLITYHYDTLGCEFTVDDVLEVLPPAAITVTNANPSSVAYEACVGDRLTINTVNLRYPISQVYAFDTNDNYTLMSLASPPTINPVVDTNIYGIDTFYNTTLVFDVPGNAYASYLMLVNGTDTTFTPFVLIHNTDLSFTGLPNMLCSNGTGITLFGNPSGGIFSVRDTTAAHALLPGVVVGNVLYPNLINPATYINGRRAVDVFYSYTETYTNGNLCPDDDTVSQRMEVKDVRLTSVQFNDVSVSQDAELLTDLVYRVQPYRARANKPNYEISFAGSFTFPAGNPTYFLPKNAGVGSHPLTYKIKNGDCINTMTANIDVVPAPNPINIPDTICRNHGTVTFGRSAAYPYLIPGPLFVNATTSYTDTFHIMKVYSTNNNQGLTVLNPNPGAEQYLYNPAIVTGNYDTLIVEYWFKRDEDTLAVDFDTLDYIVGRIYQPIHIEDLDSVTIDTSIVNPFYCEENILHLLAGNPTNNAYGGGMFMLYGGTGQYAAGDTLPNSVINPYQVNGSEGTVTNYSLVYILNGAVCKNSDTMSVTISKGLYPSFTTSNGLDEFCDSDPAVGIIHNVLSPDTAIWKIGGVPQSAYVFAPQPLNPGIHVVELQMVDTFGCSAVAKDTFTINALPSLTMTPGLSPQYCANDPTVNLIVGPAPGCPSFAAPEQYLLNEKFDAGIPPTWTILHTAGKFWTPTANLTQGGSAGAAFVDTGSVVQNSWLIADTLDLINGHTYRLTYMVRAGELNPACSGFCDASLRVGLGLTPTSLGISLDYHTDIDNDDTYVRYAVNYTHTFATGKYYLGFNSFSPAFGRSLRLDNVMLRDITVGSCNLAGIGYINGPGIHNILDSLYQFNPRAVDPGNIEVKYIYTNVKGCQDSLVYPILVDSFPIVSFTPIDSSYCANEPAFQITGSPLGGAFTSTLAGNLIHIPFTAPLDTAFYPVNYGTNVSGTDIVSYTFTDGNGCSDTYRDTVVIVPMLDSAIIDNALDPFGIGHCENALPSVLDYIAFTGAPLPGAFYGPGVRNGLAGPGAAMFHPDSAVIDMGHTGNATITYIYLTTTNCVDTTRFTTEVHALPDLSFMNLPDSLCLNAERFQLLVINSVVTGSMGQITYQDTLADQTGFYTVTDLNGLSVPILGLFDSLTPSAAMGYSELFVTYTHTVDTAQGNCTATIYDSIRIDTVPVAYFLGMQDFYCENNPQSIILAFPPYKVGSGYMLIDTLPIDTSFANANARMDSSYFWVNPLTMISPTGNTTVYPSYYTYTDTRGCRGEVYDTFEIRAFPRITFSPTFQDTFCRQPGTYNLMQEIIAPKGGVFTDNLALTSIVNDTMLNLNSAAGPRLVTYHFIDSTTTCYNNDSIWLYLFNSPFLDFNVFGGCSGMDITFDPYATNLIQGIDSITRIDWEFNTPGALTNSPLGTATTLPDIIHQYATTGTYTATLHVENQGNCVASVSKPVIISPTVAMIPDYFEDFENGPGGWYNDQEITTTPSNIWSHTNSLAGGRISDPGNGAWVTMGDSLYGKGQSAWVYSPCFDFTNSIRPMIAFDIWRDMLTDIDGVVMENYNYQTNAWDRMGDVNEGIEWYQSDFVLGRPGNQANVTYPRGWTGRSNGFESARLRLDPFKGQQFARFRIAFASSPQTVITDYEGAAFDNVWVGERTRNVLVEHFDNIAYVSPGGQNSDVIDQSVYNKIFNSAYGVDVFMIQYQTEISSTTDPVNLRTLADASARTYLYGIADDNQFMLDGRKVGTGVTSEMDPWNMDYDMLQFPDFDIAITTPTITGNTINISSTVTALKNLTQKDYVVHTVVVQDSFTVNANGFNMLSMMRKMLPNAGGTPYYQAWTMGSSVVTPESWDFSSELGQASFNSNQLEVIVFIQDMDSEEIFQVQTTQDLNKYTGTGQLEDEVAAEILDLKVYPNPSSDLFNVEFDRALEGAYNWRLVDVTGRILQTGIAEQGTKTFTIDADKLANGAYFFVINSETVYAQRKLVVIK